MHQPHDGPGLGRTAREEAERRMLIDAWAVMAAHWRVRLAGHCESRP